MKRTSLYKRMCRRHAVKRAKERYAVELSQGDVHKVKQLLDKTIHRQPQTVFFKGRICSVVYDANLKEIVTFLPSWENDVLMSLAPEFKWKEL